MNSQFKGYLFAFITLFIWSGNFVVSKTLADTIPPITLNTLRWFLAVCILLPFAYRDVIKHLSKIKKHFWLFFGLALTGIVCVNSFIYIAGHSTESINMALLVCSSPAIALIIMWVFRIEAFNPLYLIGVILSFIGVILIISQGNMHVLKNLTFTKGDLWTLAGAACFAFYSILVRYAPKDISLLAFLFALFFLGLIILLPFCFYELQDSPAIKWNITLVGCLLYLSIGMSIIGYFFWNQAIALIGPAKTMMIYYMLPLLASFESIIILGEQFTLLHVISAFLIIGGLLTTTYKPKKRTNDSINNRIKTPFTLIRNKSCFSQMIILIVVLIP